MKKLIFAIALLSIGTQSCTNENHHHSLNGSWTVVSFQNLVTGTTEYKTQENSWNKDINIQFDDTKNPKIISGINITNQISGEFNYTGKNQFKISDLGSTDVNQPRWADEFIVAITSQDLIYEIKTDRLVISYSNQSKSVTLTRD